MGVLQSCTPRKDLLSGSINLGMFTASLSEVHRHYTDGSLENPVYTDAEVFFSQGTHITPNMALVFQDVFSRLSGDTTAPLLKRLETGFGGGKTHTLIACMHLAKKGREIAPVVSGVLKDSLLPEPGEVDVVAVAGEKAPVSVTVGSDVLPFPIWAEIARQVGGKELEEKVSFYLHRLDSPDEEYFRQVFGHRKVLLLEQGAACSGAGDLRRWAAAGIRPPEDLIGIEGRQGHKWYAIGGQAHGPGRNRKVDGAERGKALGAGGGVGSRVAMISSRSVGGSSVRFGADISRVALRIVE